MMRDIVRTLCRIGPLLRSLDIFRTIGRDTVYAARSLATTRGFTFVCVASLGIGLGTFFGLVHFMRVMMAPVPAINPEGLVELLVTPLGPLRAQVGSWAKEEWSYPDFMDLRHADTGM